MYLQRKKLYHPLLGSDATVDEPTLVEILVSALWRQRAPAGF